MASPISDGTRHPFSEPQDDSELELSAELEAQPSDRASSSTPSTPSSSAEEEDPWQIVSDQSIIQGSVWYADGNVIMQAENTQFKVFQGVLTSHSPVFAAILEDIEIEEVDGCRIIRTDDAAEDMRYFLEAFHCLTLPDGLSDLRQICAFLKLGTRYQVPPIQRLAIKTLCTSYPSSLSSWSKRQGYRTFVPTHGASLEILNLARAYQIKQILPTVMYQCARFCAYRTLMQGFSGHRIADPMDVQRCVIAKAQFAQAVKQSYAFLGDETPVKGCAYSAAGGEEGFDPGLSVCVLEKYRLMRSIWAQDTSPLGVQIDWATFKACRACVSHAKAMVKAERQKYWDSLPTLFGLNG